MYHSRFTRVMLASVVEIDGFDLWGSTMEMFFAVASVLDMTDIEGNVSPEPFARWQYGRAPFTIPAVETVAARADDFSEGEFADDYSHAQVMLASAYVNGEVTQSDLVYAGDVLSRYTDLLRRNGRDY